VSYVYVKSEPGLYTVGFYDPTGKWQSESDHSNREEAAERVAWLNGGPSPCIARERAERLADQIWRESREPTCTVPDLGLEPAEIVRRFYKNL
jgi:hypothetical protein